jgi:hypothetical protein
MIILSFKFSPLFTAEDSKDPFPDECLNPNSFRGACELSVRQMYREGGYAHVSAGISNAVEQSRIMAPIDALRFDPESGVVKVLKRGGEPWEVHCTTAEAANTVRDMLSQSEMTVVFQ